MFSGALLWQRTRSAVSRSTRSPRRRCVQRLPRSAFAFAAYALPPLRARLLRCLLLTLRVAAYRFSARCATLRAAPFCYDFTAALIHFWV